MQKFLDLQKIWKNFWTEVVDTNGFADYWTRDPEEDGFAGVISHSIPNFIFKNLLRWSMEMMFGGHGNMMSERELWAAAGPKGRDDIVRTKLTKGYEPNPWFGDALKDPRVGKFLFRHRRFRCHFLQNW